jgi:hypothetical protein
MAKRPNALRAQGKSKGSPKTKKRLAVKRAMLEARKK